MLHKCLQLPDSRFLVLVRATAQQAEQLEAEARAARIAGIHDAAGFAAVFDLMRRRCGCCDCTSLLGWLCG